MRNKLGFDAIATGYASRDEEKRLGQSATEPEAVAEHFVLEEQPVVPALVLVGRRNIMGIEIGGERAAASEKEKKKKKRSGGQQHNQRAAGRIAAITKPHRVRGSAIAKYVSAHC